MTGPTEVRAAAAATPESIERFWSRVNRTKSCWLWMAGHNGDGYGYVTFGNVSVSAHRMAYFLTRGPIPPGMHLDHLCRVHGCVNPDHLEPVTGAVNILRGISPTAINHRRTQCKNGHEFTPDNTRYDRGKRYCLECKRRRTRLTARKRRARERIA